MPGATETDRPRRGVTAFVPSARGVGRALGVLVAALVAVSVVGQVALRLSDAASVEVFARRFNVDAESSVPAYVSSALPLAAAGLLALTARVVGHGWRSRWAALAAVFVGLSMDEAMMIHEAFVEPVRAALGTSGVLYFAWVVPGALFVAVVGAAYVPFLLRQPPWLRRLMTAAGALYVGGALGLELVAGALVTAGLDGTWPYVAVRGRGDGRGGVRDGRRLAVHLRARRPLRAPRRRGRRPVRAVAPPGVSRGGRRRGGRR